jgi:hypothetical protein
MICGIIMLIFGILALAQGKFLLTRSKAVTGGPVIAIGILLIAPLPLGFLAGMVLGSMMLVQGDRASVERFESTATAVGIAIPVICLVAALVIAAVYAKPVEKRRPRYEDEGEYDDRPRPPRDRFDEGERPRRRPPDDRIRE